MPGRGEFLRLGSNEGAGSTPTLSDSGVRLYSAIDCNDESIVLEYGDILEEHIEYYRLSTYGSAVHGDQQQYARTINCSIRASECIRYSSS